MFFSIPGICQVCYFIKKREMKNKLVIAVVLIVCCMIFCSCANEQNERVNCDKVSGSKEEVIDLIKELLDVSSVYGFDCDFSNCQGFNINNVAYNSCVSGYKIKDDNGITRMDYNNQIIIKFVANYSITTGYGCFGMTVVSNVNKPKMNSYVNNELYKTTENVVYGAETYKENSFRDFQYDGTTTYQVDQSSQYVAVDDSFFNGDRNNACSVELKWVNLDTNNDQLMVDDIPVRIYLYFTSFDEFQNNSAFVSEFVGYCTDNFKYGMLG